MRKYMKRKNKKTTKSEETNGVSEQQSDNDDQSASGSEKASDEPPQENGAPEAKKRKGASNNMKKDEADDAETNYEVEAVVGEKKIKGVRHFLIRWKGYKADSDTWEPESTVNCLELIKQYRASQKDNKKTEKRTTKKVNKKTTKKATDKNDESEFDENEEFEVDRILDVYNKRNGKRDFLVSWKGYPQSANSWEPEENLECNDLIAKFMSKVKKAKESDPHELRLKRKHTDRFTLNTQSTDRRLSKRSTGKQRKQYHETE